MFDDSYGINTNNDSLSNLKAKINLSDSSDKFNIQKEKNLSVLDQESLWFLY